MLFGLARGQQTSEVNGVGGKRREIAAAVQIFATGRVLLQSPPFPDRD